MPRDRPLHTRFPKGWWDERSLQKFSVEQPVRAENDGRFVDRDPPFKSTLLLARESPAGESVC